MSKAKFDAAKELIRDKKYAEARSVLATIDHPTAREWEQKLNRIAPISQPVQKKRNRLGCILWTLVIGIVVFTWLLGVSNGPNPNKTTAKTAQQIQKDIADDLGILAGGRHIELVSVDKRQDNSFDITVAYLTSESTEAGYIDEWIDLFDSIAYSIRDRDYTVTDVTLMMGSAGGYLVANIIASGDDVLAYDANKITRGVFIQRLQTVDFSSIP